MKRARDARLDKHLGEGGFLVLGHQEADPHIARILGLPIPSKGEFVSCRVKPVGADYLGPKVFLADQWWSLAAEGETVGPAPKRESFKTSSTDLLEYGPAV